MRRRIALALSILCLAMLLLIPAQTPPESGGQLATRYHARNRTRSFFQGKSHQVPRRAQTGTHAR